MAGSFITGEKKPRPGVYFNYENIGSFSLQKNNHVPPILIDKNRLITKDDKIFKTKFNELFILA